MDKEKIMTTNTTVLVTGGSGYVGLQCILQLLEEGFTVKTTVRSLTKKEEIIKILKNAGISSFEKLSFFEADLTQDTNWSEAVEGCDYVLHVASPFPAENPSDENELIIPARDGALQVLKASRDAGVKRVVLTSSFAVIGYSNSSKNHIFTEKDWTDPNTPALVLLQRSYCLNILNQHSQLEVLIGCVDKGQIKINEKLATLY